MWSFSVEYRKPHGWLIGRGPLDPVPPMGWDGHMIARLQVNRLSISLEQQLGFAFQHDHPLGFLLIVPLECNRHTSGAVGRLPRGTVRRVTVTWAAKVAHP
jgi:hypothetical protein